MYFIKSLFLILTLTLSAQSDFNYKEKNLKDLTYLYSETYKDSLEIGKEYALEAYELAREINDTVQILKAGLYLGKADLLSNNRKSAENYFSTTLQTARNFENIHYETRALACLGELNYKSDNYEQAIKYLKESEKLNSIVDDDQLEIQTNFYLALSHNKLIQRKEASNYAFKIIEEQNKVISIDPSILIQTYAMLSIIYQDIGEIQKGIDYLLISLNLSEQNGDWKTTAKNYVRLAGLYKNYGYFDKSKTYYEKAIEVNEHHNDKHGLGYTYMNYGGFYFRQEIYDKAMKKYKTALIYFYDTKSNHYLAFTLNNIGEIFSNTGELDSAKIYIKKALEYGLLSNNKIAIGFSQHSLGKIAKAEGRWNDAIYHFRNSLKEEFIGTTEQNYFQISNIYDTIGKPDSALHYLRLRNLVRDSVINMQAQQTLVDKGLKYEIAKMEEKLSATIEENKNLTEKFNTSRNLTFFFIIGGFMIVGFVFFYYRNKTVRFIQKLRPLTNKASSDRRRLKKVMKAIDNYSDEIENGKTVDEKLLKEIVEKLEKLMTEEKIFLNPNLSQSEVAKRLGTNTAYLSRITNHHYNLNFSSYVNKHRVQEAKSIITNDKESIYTFEGIAKSSGFSSKSAFYTSLKKFTGKTPSEFSAEIHKNNK